MDGHSKPGAKKMGTRRRTGPALQPYDFEKRLLVLLASLEEGGQRNERSASNAHPSFLPSFLIASLTPSPVYFRAHVPSRSGLRPSPKAYAPAALRPGWAVEHILSLSQISTEREIIWPGGRCRQHTYVPTPSNILRPVLCCWSFIYRGHRRRKSFSTA